VSAYDDAGQAPPNVGGAVLKRALLAMLMVALLSGAAISAYVFREVDAVTHAFLGPGRQQIVIPEIDKAAAGGARTILILGSDERYADKKTGAKPRSDTILLVRADPN
jgi:anionic cell wall polymer biosynthesis LytR-Cps2A-Psr (LCP) family protein